MSGSNSSQNQSHDTTSITTQLLHDFFTTSRLHDFFTTSQLYDFTTSSLLIHTPTSSQLIVSLHKISKCKCYFVNCCLFAFAKQISNIKYPFSLLHMTGSSIFYAYNLTISIYLKVYSVTETYQDMLRVHDICSCTKHTSAHVVSNITYENIKGTYQSDVFQLLIVGSITKPTDYITSVHRKFISFFLCRSVINICRLICHLNSAAHTLKPNNINIFDHESVIYCVRINYFKKLFTKSC